MAVTAGIRLRGRLDRNDEAVFPAAHESGHGTSLHSRPCNFFGSYRTNNDTSIAGKDAPLGRAVQRDGTIVAVPILSGLHHGYARI